MLVLTQVAVGTSVLGAVLALAGRHQVPDAVPALGLAVAAVALGASLGHLGRPHLAYRAVVGFRHSWLSREIVAFGAFAAVAVAQAALTPLGTSDRVDAVVGTAAAVTGGVGVGCSVLLYAVTGRPWWRARTTAVRFGSTAVGAGALTVAAVTLAWPPGPGAEPTARGLLLLAVAVTVLGLLTQAGVLRARAADPDLRATRRLLLGPLSNLLLLRLLAAGIGGVAVPLATAASLRTGTTTTGPAIATAAALLAFVAGELTERRLFFLASVAPRAVGGRTAEAR